MDNEIKTMFNTILEEMGRIEEKTAKRFDKIELELESLHHEVNACKLERDSISLLIKNLVKPHSNKLQKNGWEASGEQTAGP